MLVQFPEQPLPWPTSGLRRASVNSFGYGGSNSHIVLDDAYNYLRLRGLHGKHNTVTKPSSPGSPLTATSATRNNSRAQEGIDVHSSDRTLETSRPPKLIILSAADRLGIQRITESIQDWHSSCQIPVGDLDDLAYTLDSHRSQLTWRSFALVGLSEDLETLSTKTSAPEARSPEKPRLGFVFSGQGAQWFGMGRELLEYITFKKEVEQSGEFLRSLGCLWSPMGRFSMRNEPCFWLIQEEELQKCQSQSRVDKAEFSQALCTIIQVAVVNLLRRFDVFPSAVVGHSSGEIAAA